VRLVRLVLFEIARWITRGERPPRGRTQGGGSTSTLSLSSFSGAWPGRASWHHHHHHQESTHVIRYLTCYLTYLRYSGTVTSGRLSTRPLIKSLEHVELPQLSQTQSDIPVFHLGGHSRSAYHHIYHHLSRTDMTRQSCWTDRCT